ncbi:MAG: TIR domain-containing protein [Muribaculaceae bacterium]|nr:TIR domain-containing protein [Lachnospiraceae bacterium]MCM1295343.1 TIR domain-containing protein [Muribaculaceae bacterium]
MKVFISYHRADTKFKEKLVAILDYNGIPYYCVPTNANFDGWSHNEIAGYIRQELKDCDTFLCIVGKETYSRPHVDNEIHEALKGAVGKRKGIVAVMLENRLDNKNKINFDTFPVKLAQNLKYIVLEQFSSINDNILKALNLAEENSKNKNIQTNHSNHVMALRSGKYYETN